MDHPGFSQPPMPPSGVRHFPPGRGDQTVKIEQASGALKLVERPTRIEGEVIRHNRDGTVRIRTDRGELDVRVRGRDIPAEGQRVEIDLPAGKPPRQAVIRPAPETRQPAAPPPQSLPPEERTPDTARAQPRISQDVARNLATQSAPAPETRRVPLRPDDIVRLLSLPPDLTNHVVRGTAETIKATLARIIAASRPLPLPAAMQPAAPVTTLPLRQPPAILSAFPAADGLRIGPAVPAGAPFTMAGSISGLLPPAAGGLESAPWQGFPESRPQLLDIRISRLVPPGVTLSAPDEIAGEAGSRPAGPKGMLSAIALPEGQAGTLRGQVIGTASNQLPVIQVALTPDAWPELFVLQFPASNLPPGTVIEFLPLPGAVSAARTPLTPSPAATSPTPLPQLFTGFDWPALEDLIKAAQQATPHVTPNLTRILPSPAAPARLPLAALIFIAAVQAGDLTNWLGQKTIDTLRRAGRGEALDRLGRDFTGLQKAGAEPVSQDWRAMTLPLFWQDQIHKIHLYYRRDGRDDESGNENRQTRFIFDLDLTRMGAVQLDGLHRGKKLDLIVRTRTPLSPAMQKTMRRNYIRALEQVDVSGELSFQGRPEQFVKLDMTRETGGFTA